MPVTPSFYLNFNAESCTVYHTDDVSFDRPELLSGDGLAGDTRWKLGGHRAIVTESRTHVEGSSATHMTTTVCNEGDEPLVLDSLSSAFITGIGAEGRRWYDDRFILHYAHMAWQGEAQWRSASLEEVGLYPTYNHGHQPTFRISSQGSWTTARYYPLILLEDIERGETHYFEILTGSGWYMEVGVKGYQDNSALCVLLSACHEKNDGWFKTLDVGEAYTTAPAVYGCVS